MGQEDNKLEMSGLFGPGGVTPQDPDSKDSNFISGEGKEKLEAASKAAKDTAIAATQVARERAEAAAGKAASWAVEAKAKSTAWLRNSKAKRRQKDVGHRAGADMTFSAPMSVSILMAEAPVERMAAPELSRLFEPQPAKRNWTTPLLITALAIATAMGGDWYWQGRPLSTNKLATPISKPKVAPAVRVVAPSPPPVIGPAQEVAAPIVTPAAVVPAPEPDPPVVPVQAPVVQSVSVPQAQGADPTPVQSKPRARARHDQAARIETAMPASTDDLSVAKANADLDAYEKRMKALEKDYLTQFGRPNVRTSHHKEKMNEP
jgi:hypothetical protein